MVVQVIAVLGPSHQDQLLCHQNVRSRVLSSFHYRPCQKRNSTDVHCRGWEGAPSLQPCRRSINGAHALLPCLSVLFFLPLRPEYTIPTHLIFCIISPRILLRQTAAQDARTLSFSCFKSKTYYWRPWAQYNRPSLQLRDRSGRVQTSGPWSHSKSAGS